MHGVTLILVAIFVCVVMASKAGQSKGRRSKVLRLLTNDPDGPKYRAREILTANEGEFFHRLRTALPDAYIFPQVAMAALIEPRANRREQHKSDFGRISQKRVDYAVYTKDMMLLAVIELDDRTHDAQKDARRDAMLASAGIRTIRFESSKRPDIATIQDAVLPEFVPARRAADKPMEKHEGIGPL